ncbi:hypothetical protein MAQ58_24755, partial [Enterobacter sp. DRP3]|nr:hypothetical protein [Enterobacter sp. DRP3]
MRIVPARHRSRTAGTVLALVLIALTLHSILGNPQWGWPVFAEWFLSPPVLSGLARTLVLTLLLVDALALAGLPLFGNRAGSAIS